MPASALPALDPRPLQIRAVRDAGGHTAVPDASRRGDLRRRRPRRAVGAARRPGLRRRASPEPGDHTDGPGGDPGRWDAGGLSAGDPLVPRPRSRADADRAAADPAAGRGRGRACSPRSGPNGIIGPALDDLGIRLPLTTAGVVVALVFVASPFYLRQATAAFGALDPTLLEASSTLGAPEHRTFARVAVPLSLPSLATGAALAWGRALGEFGATLMFAGSFRGVTQTAPLAIFELLGRTSRRRWRWRPCSWP